MRIKQCTFRKQCTHLTLVHLENFVDVFKKMIKVKLPTEYTMSEFVDLRVNIYMKFFVYKRETFQNVIISIGFV